VKRESDAPKRYIDEVFQELSPQRKTLRVKADGKLYSVVVTDVEKIGKRVKIHYVGYSERYDESRSCGTDDILFQRMEPLFIPSAPSFDDRAELFHSELYREIKRTLYSGRKDDPATRIEIRIDQDVFDGGLASAGESRKERGNNVYRVNSNQALDRFLGVKWDERIFNENGDFASVIEGTVRHFRRWVPQKASSTGNI